MSHHHQNKCSQARKMLLYTFTNLWQTKKNLCTFLFIMSTRNVLFLSYSSKNSIMKKEDKKMKENKTTM